MTATTDRSAPHDGADAPGVDTTTVNAEPREGAGTSTLGPSSSGRAVIDTVEGGRITRFDRVERWLHWANASLVLILIATGSIMYVDVLASIFGRRTLVEAIHLWAGLALPLPFLAVLAGRWGRGFRRDARRLGRVVPGEWRWFRQQHRKAGTVRLAKFNPGQKANATLVAASLPIMLATGALMKWHDPFQDAWRTGATFVHDLGYVALTLLVIGHIRQARRDPESMAAMRRGRPVTQGWARDHHPRWHAEVNGIVDHVVPPADPVDCSSVPGGTDSLVVHLAPPGDGPGGNVDNDAASGANVDHLDPVAASGGIVDLVHHLAATRHDADPVDPT